MYEFTLDEIITAAYQKDFSQYSNESDHVFSGRHNRAMKRIFRLFEKQKNNSFNKYELSAIPKWNRKALFIALVAIFLAVLAGCTAVIYYCGGFRTVSHYDNTELFAVDVGDSPVKIEKEYSLGEIPQGFEIIEEDGSDYYKSAYYGNSETNDYIVLMQWIKKIYKSHISTEGYITEETEINGKNGIIIDYSDENNPLYSIIWDDGEYIFQLYGTMFEEQMLYLAENLKINNN